MDTKEFETKVKENQLELQKIRDEYLENNSIFKVGNKVMVSLFKNEIEICVIEGVSLKELPTRILYNISDENGNKFTVNEEGLKLYVESNKKSLKERFMYDLTNILSKGGRTPLELSDLLLAIDWFEAPLKYARKGRKGEMLFWDSEDVKVKTIYDLTKKLNKQTNEFYAFMCSYLEFSYKIEGLDALYDSYEDM